jgi:hypothetical protein
MRMGAFRASISMIASSLALVGALGAARHRISESPAAHPAAASQASLSALQRGANRHPRHGSGTLARRSATAILSALVGHTPVRHGGHGGQRNANYSFNHGASLSMPPAAAPQP